MTTHRLNWRPHTEAPRAPISAVIAAELDEDVGMYLVGGVYTWVDGEWVEEITGEVLSTDTAFWWLPEEELVQTITTTTAVCH